MKGLRILIFLTLYLINSCIAEYQYGCNVRNCRRPKCRCASHIPPTNMAREEIPQMVVFTLDDVVAGGDFFSNFEDLFTTMGKNPNQCSVGVTFFTSLSSGTNTCVMEKIISKGHEIAAYSVDQRTSKGWWKAAEAEDWTKESAGFRDKLEGIIATRLVKGWRTPFLITGGDIQYEVLKRENFLYDSTMIVDNKTTNQPPLWPFTLDHGTPLECSTQKCPLGSYPGLWEVPVQIHSDMNDEECLFIDRCIHPPKNDEEMFELFWKNFKKHYETNRAPIIFSMQVAWLKSSNITEEGFKRFLKELNSRKDVYIVTMTQMIEWMKKPTPLDKIINFEPWQCHFRFRGKVTCDFESRDSILNKYWWIEVPVLTLIYLVLFLRDRNEDR